MENKVTQATNTFSNGFNCAQSVLSVFAEEHGLSKDVSMKLATPFGAGMVYMQETCGAVTGGLMAIGLKYGRGENGLVEDKEKTYDISRYFLSEFKKRHKTICCRELLDRIDMSTQEGMNKIKEMDFFRLRCAIYVIDTIEIVEKIFNKI